uniref:Uncharacterized protein n=1 Tax=Schistocephalus solidus TaxID=70667 RepID=A0A0X3NQC8_SCHSO
MKQWKVALVTVSEQIFISKSIPESTYISFIFCCNYDRCGYLICYKARLYRHVCTCIRKQDLTKEVDLYRNSKLVLMSFNCYEKEMNAFKKIMKKINKFRKYITGLHRSCDFSMIIFMF